jgi:hypothetical protein
MDAAGKSAATRARDRQGTLFGRPVKSAAAGVADNSGGPMAEGVDGQD